MEKWQQIARSFETYDLEDTGSAFNPWRDMVKQVPSGPHSHFGDYVLTEDACKRIAELEREVARRPDIPGMLAKFAELTGDPICADPEATEWVSWPETFASTAGPHGGIGGQAITAFQVYGFRGGNHAMMCCAGKWRRWANTSEMSWERGGE